MDIWGYGHVHPTPTPFVAPNFPGALTIVGTATSVQAIAQKEPHNEETRVYRKCKNVKKALLQHIQPAVEEKLIDYLVDEDTGLLEEDIPTVLEYLFTNYGKVTSDEVK